MRIRLLGSGDGGSIDFSSVTDSVHISSAEGSVDSSAVGSGSIPGSSEGSSIDVGSIIPLAGDIGDSVGGIGFPGS